MEKLSHTNSLKIVFVLLTIAITLGNGCSPSSSGSGRSVPPAPGNGTLKAESSSIMATPASVAADGTAVSSVTVTLTNEDGDPLPGRTVSLVSSRGNVDTISAPDPAVTNNLGQTKFEIKSSSLGEADLIAKSVANGKITESQKISILFLAATPESDYQARLFDRVFPGSNAVRMKDDWKDLASVQTARYATLKSFDFTNTNGWVGNGSLGSPFALAFDGDAHKSIAEFDNQSNSYANFSFETWLKPSATQTLNTIILSNGLSQFQGTVFESHNGMTLRQSPLHPGRLELQLGTVRSYSEEIRSDLPLGYWKLDEATQDTAVDMSGNDNHGIYGAAAVLNQTTALLGTSGSSMKSEALAVSGLSVVAGTSHTCEAWVNLGDIAGSAIDGLVVAGDSVTNNYCLYLSDNGIYYSSFTGSYVGIPFNFSSNTWYHIAVVRYDNNVDFYVDGAQVGPSMVLARNEPSTFTNLGSYGNGSFAFKGYIDEVAIYPTALSYLKIAAHAIAGKKRMHCLSKQNWDDTNWHHVSGVFNSIGTPTLSLFIDGVKQCEVTSPTAQYAGSTAALRIGASLTDSGFWSGFISDFRTYSSVLTENDINQNLLITKNRFQSGP